VRVEEQDPEHREKDNGEEPETPALVAKRYQHKPSNATRTVGGLMFTDLVDEESRSGQLRVLAGRGVLHELEVRVSVGDVPDTYGEKEDQGRRGRSDTDRAS
jgi:hypothetical protein